MRRERRGSRQEAEVMIGQSSVRSRAIALALLTVSSLSLLVEATPCFADDDEAELAKKLQNPVADLISVPLQSNLDFTYQDSKTTRYTLNVQPVIPISITEDWNVITRTILPVIDANSQVPGADDNSGLGDTTQSFFFSPKEPVRGWILGAGPVLYYPTATQHSLGGQKWGAGPTAVVLRQESGWTYGALVNHIQSFAGSSARETISATFLQPFVSYTFKTLTTLTLNTESTYDWEDSQWTVPINVMAAQLMKFGRMPVQFQLGARAYAERPTGGPDWGLRFAVTLLLPK
jgi:hypothetical protein